MGKIIAIANQKGGVGKTTTSINLAAGLAYCKKRILLIDLDPQGNATQGLGARNKISYSSYNLLLHEQEVKDCIISSSQPPLDLVPATIDLAGADLEMVSFEVGTRERFLKKKLDEVRDQYDFIIIDCPPSLGLLNTNALTAADSVIIPVQCEYYALEGLNQLLSTIRLVKKLYNPHLFIEGVLLTMFSRNQNLSSEVQAEVRKFFKERVYNCVIPRNVKLSEAPSKGKSVFEHDVYCEGAKAYALLAKEVIARNS